LVHLEPAVQRHPEDVGAQEAKAWALWLLDRPYEAVITIEASLKTAPNRESALQTAATFAENLKQQQAAMEYWRRLVEINPGLPSYRSQLANLLALEKDWPVPSLKRF
jgi:tetratricopeptide (TPR) repeat protein